MQSKLVVQFSEEMPYTVVLSTSFISVTEHDELFSGVHCVCNSAEHWQSVLFSYLDNWSWTLPLPYWYFRGTSVFFFALHCQSSRAQVSLSSCVISASPMQKCLIPEYPSCMPWFQRCSGIESHGSVPRLLFYATHIFTGSMLPGGRKHEHTLEVDHFASLSPRLRRLLGSALWTASSATSACPLPAPLSHGSKTWCWKAASAWEVPCGTKWQR